MKHEETNLPIVNKMVRNKLVLKDYTLDKGHISSLSETIVRTGKPSIEQVYLNNCGIDDEEASILFEGFLGLENFNRLCYLNNEFKYNALTSLKPILVRPDPHNLVELRLVNCDTSKLITKQLCEFLYEYKVELRALSLV